MKVCICNDKIEIEKIANWILDWTSGIPRLVMYAIDAINKCTDISNTCIDYYS